MPSWILLKVLQLMLCGRGAFRWRTRYTVNPRTTAARTSTKARLSMSPAYRDRLPRQVNVPPHRAGSGTFVFRRARHVVEWTRERWPATLPPIMAQCQPTHPFEDSLMLTFWGPARRFCD